MANHITIQSITDISTEEDFRKTETMSRAILCLVFVAVLASIGHGRVIEKRSPSFYDNTYVDAIDAVGDFGSDAIDEINDFANSDEVRRVGNKVVDVANDVGDAFVDARSAIGDLFG